jgi:uncharacterized protein (TIRG00374 family)
VLTRRRVALLVCCAASSLAGGWFAVRGLSLSVLVSQLATARLGWVAVSLGFLAAAIAVRSLRWWMLFPPGRRPSLPLVSEATLIGYLFNNILPARAGEAARVIALRRSGQSTLGEITGTVISERLVDTASLIILFAAASPWVPVPVISQAWLLLLAGTVVIGFALIAVIAFAPGIVGDRVPMKLLPTRLAEQAGELRNGLTSVLTQPSVAISCTALTMASWVLMGISDWSLLRSFNLPVGVEGGLLIALATGIAMIVPSAPASLGVFEATTVLVLRGYPVGHAAAVTYALCLHALNIVPLVVAGAIAMLTLAHRQQAPLGQSMGVPVGTEPGAVEIVVTNLTANPDKAAQAVPKQRR